MKKPALPKPSDPGFPAAVKEVLESVTGRRGGAIKLLPSDASMADVAAKVNELILRLMDDDGTPGATNAATFTEL